MINSRIENSEILVLEKKEDEYEFLRLLDGSLDDEGRDTLEWLFSLIPKPFSIVLEYHYVDKVFRDSYYTYFSSKHFDTERNCRRLSFFEGNDIEYDDFLSQGGHSKLQRKFIGFTVIKPISPGSIGRTLVDPSKLAIDKCFIRTTEFSVMLLGAKLTVESFPFSSQDAETMTCAETTVWTLLEYFANRYPDYQAIYPSDIIEVLKRCSYERTLPSRGLQYDQISTLLKEFGFAPRIYDSEAYPSEDFKHLFHYYVESGIPIAVGISGTYDGEPVGHAVVCIGHSQKNYDIKCSRIDELYVINSADFFNDYVIMDDNQIPFVVQSYDRMSVFEDTKVDGIIVPLYKRIFLEAGDASAITFNALTESAYGIKHALEEYESEDNPLVVRLYLTSSRSFKAFRSINYGHPSLGEIYTHLPMPKFIWVAELSLKNLYLQEKVFGEIIIDATAARYTGTNSLVAIHYPGYFGYRLPHEPLSKIFDMLSVKSDEAVITYPLYKSNLILGGR